MNLIRSDFIDSNTISHILWALTPANRLVCEVCLHTGWRVDDVLNITTGQINEALNKNKATIKITEKKTGKKSTKSLPRELCKRIKEQAGRIYCFESRDDYRKPRTRQAVYIDLKKASKRFNIKINLSPHSLRKNYAVYLKKCGKTAQQIQKELNHDNYITTLLYMLADELQQKYK